MSVGAGTLAITVDPVKRTLVCVGTVHFREAVAVTISGASPSIGPNLTMLVFRGATRVCNPPTFAGTDPATGSLDLNTDALAEVFDGIQNEVTREFDVRLWDSSSKELIGIGILRVLGVSETYAGDIATTPVDPINPGVDGWANLKNIGGVVHIYDGDATPPKWYPLTMKGAGDERHLDTGSDDEGVPA